jgi:hypothetical protein
MPEAEPHPKVPPVLQPDERIVVEGIATRGSRFLAADFFGLSGWRQTPGRRRWYLTSERVLCVIGSQGGR